MDAENDSKAWEPVAVALGIRIQQERERLGLTKEALAELSGLASRYLWRAENGRQNIQLSNISKIAAALGLTLSDLFAGIEQLVEHPPEKPPVKPRGPAARRPKA